MGTVRGFPLRQMQLGKPFAAMAVQCLRGSDSPFCLYCDAHPYSSRYGTFPWHPHLLALEVGIFVNHDCVSQDLFSCSMSKAVTLIFGSATDDN